MKLLILMHSNQLMKVVADIPRLDLFKQLDIRAEFISPFLKFIVMILRMRRENLTRI
jgi:hypothetical protein